MLSFPAVLTFWIVYGLVHGIFRYAASRTLTLDDARANELVQNFALGYQIRQPPLYEWILWSVQQILGPALPSHLVVRYALIALIGVTTFGAARAAVKDTRWAAAASYSLIFCYPVSWTFHEWATQTLLLCSACMLTLHAAIVYLEKPSVRAAAFLGGALALGMYSKFSFPLMAGGLLLAALSLPETRRKLADRRLLLSVAIFAVALLPYAIWVLQVRGDIPADISNHLVEAQRPYVERAAQGLWRLVRAATMFLLPWAPIVVLLAQRAFFSRGDTARPASLVERLSFRTMLFALLLTVAGILTVGATNIAARYMHPILFVAPVYVFARLARFGHPGVELHRFAVACVITAVALLGVRFVSVTDHPFAREAGRRLLLPYAALADVLMERGITHGTVRSVDVRDSGNLRAFIPGLRVIADSSLRVEPPPIRGEGGACYRIWIDESSVGRGNGQPVRLPPGTEIIEIPPQPKWIAPSWGARWYLLRLEPDSQACN